MKPRTEDKNMTQERSQAPACCPGKKPCMINLDPMTGGDKEIDRAENSQMLCLLYACMCVSLVKG